MGPITTALRELMAAGLTGDALIDAVARIEDAQMSTGIPPDIPPDKTAEKRRAWDRNRKRVHRNSGGIPPDRVDALCVREERKKEEERKQASARARCPPDFWPNDASSMHAYRMQWTDDRLAAEVVRFRDDALAHDRMYADWQAAFRKWISSPYQTNGGQNGKTQIHAANPHGKTASDVARELLQDCRDEQSEFPDRVFPQIGRG